MSEQRKGLSVNGSAETLTARVFQSWNVQRKPHARPMHASAKGVSAVLKKRTALIHPIDSLCFFTFNVIALALRISF
jgi:hypothetical protein